ncbi:hypothetical protein B0H10DRAFT_1786205 [Mycena sp. CBHHK59/15]|nr:hypothetical protein B0H10DRAFT_1786205 [Mycena sp. CBHHK59/15]
MSNPRPLQSFLGGLGLSLPVHALLLLNGSIFGISGFLHRAVHLGGSEARASTLGLLFGGMFVGMLEGAGPQPFPLAPSRLLLSGFLVGVGSKMANGCTSGHMIAGISRFSLRSITATAAFFSAGIITARLLHGDFLPAPSPDWALGATGKALLAFQAIPFIISTLLYIFVRSRFIKRTRSTFQQLSQAPSKPEDTVTKGQPSHPMLRLVASLSTSFEFALALRLSNLTEPIRVISFLLLPSHEAFDPSLAFLALGALPLAIFLYQFARGSEQPRLGGNWSVPKGGQVDTKLIIGATLFGIGWGLSGLCPGPGIVNLGRALTGASNPVPMLGWLAAVVGGGYLV